MVVSGNNCTGTVDCPLEMAIMLAKLAPVTVASGTSPRATDGSSTIHSADEWLDVYGICCWNTCWPSTIVTCHTSNASSWMSKDTQSPGPTCRATLREVCGNVSNHAWYWARGPLVSTSTPAWMRSVEDVPPMPTHDATADVLDCSPLATGVWMSADTPE